MKTPSLSKSSAARYRALAGLFAAVAAGAAAAASIDLPARPPTLGSTPPAQAPAPAVDTSGNAVQRVDVTGVGVSPAGQHAPRTGAYSVKYEGSMVVRARCLEGGTVIVAKNSFARMPGGSPEEKRDAALRESCKDVDYSK